jgi:hypothetical protein
MRTIESHKVAGNEKNELDIVVTDEPGAGGANHSYAVWIASELNDPDCDLALGPLHTVNFQNGPIPVNGINGVTQEVLLAIVKDRLECFQNGPFPCAENEAALAFVSEALEILKNRTRDRIARAVEGKLKA